MLFRSDWSEEKQELLDYKASRNAFFVRTTSDKAAIEAAFGQVAYVEADIAGTEGETAFTTEVMTEAEFEEQAALIEVVNRIRLG